MFLGDFANDSITLSLSGLPTHSSVEAALDLYILRSMDGNNGDLLSMGVVNGTDLLNSTFTNPLTPTSGPNQSYPDNYPASHAPRTGASAIDALDYNTVSKGYLTPVFGDSTYHLTFAFDHSDSSIQLYFTGSGMAASLLPAGQQPGTPEQILLDEGWGIDNVSIVAVPDPRPLEPPAPFRERTPRASTSPDE